MGYNFEVLGKFNILHIKDVITYFTKIQILFFGIVKSGKSISEAELFLEL